MSDRIVTLSVDETPEGRLQVSINLAGPDGGGHGYRISGPKYDSRSKNLQEIKLDARAARAIRWYLGQIDAVEAEAAP